MPITPEYTAALIHSLMDNGMQPEQVIQNTTPSRSHTPIHLALAAMGGGQAADVLSTLNAYKRGAVEANPLYGEHPSAGRIIATKAAVMGPIAYLLDRIYNKHPKLATAIALGAGAAGVGTAIHNSKVGK